MLEIESSRLPQKDRDKLKLGCGAALGTVLSICLLGSLSCSQALASGQASLNFSFGPKSLDLLIASDRKAVPGQGVNWGALADFGQHSVSDMNTGNSNLQLTVWYCDPNMPACLVEKELVIH